MIIIYLAIGMILGTAFVIGLHYFVTIVKQIIRLCKKPKPEKTWPAEFAERFCERLKEEDDEGRLVMLQAFMNREKGEDDTYE